MRFWKGTLGCLLGVLGGMLVGGYVAGTVGEMLNDLTLLCVMATFVAAFGSLMLGELKPDASSFWHHVRIGVASIGGIMMGIFVLSYAILPPGFPWFSITEFVMALAFSAFVGACGGSGFYALARDTRK